MALRLQGYIELPANRAKGGFDHADVHLPTDWPTSRIPATMRST